MLEERIIQTSLQSIRRVVHDAAKIHGNINE